MMSPKMYFPLKLGAHIRGFGSTSEYFETAEYELHTRSGNIFWQHISIWVAGGYRHSNLATIQGTPPGVGVVVPRLLVSGRKKGWILGI